MTNPAIDQVTVSAVVVMLVQWAKNSTWVPFLQKHTDALNRLVAWGAAALTALGLHLVYDSTAHTLTISGLALASILHGGWDWIKSIAVQELIYKGVFKADAGGLKLEAGSGPGPAK
jgi:hypothetical protein